MLGGLLFSITGFGILRFSDDVHAKYGAVYLNAIGVFAASSGFLSWGINSRFPLRCSRIPTSATCSSILTHSCRHEQSRRCGCRRWLHGLDRQHRGCPLNVSLPPTSHSFPPTLQY
jgi:hypothetical protein